MNTALYNPPHHRHKTTHRQVELLAPAGSPESFWAALKAGADAVYFGVETLNARRNAENFTLDALDEYLQAAHLSDMRMYLTLNTVVTQAEINQALAIVERALELGVDAFIIQDYGLLTQVKSRFPEAECHISTQANMHDVAAVKFAALLGADRVTVSRESRLHEIKAMAETGMDLEVFAHGALCISYSGECLMSSMIGRRSANRGMCAQPCRMEYQLVDDEQNSTAQVAGNHLLSPKDLATLHILPDLVAAGATSLKIEGRMKSADYVGITTSVYRKALDDVLADPAGYKPDPAAFQQLTEAFSRGFTEAFLADERGNEMMSYGRPNNRGIAVGRVDRFFGGKVALKTTREINPGDVLEVWTQKGRITHTVLPVEVTSRDGRQDLLLAFEKPVQKGDRVFRVKSAALIETQEQARLHHRPRKRPITGSITMKLGEPVSLMLSCLDARGEVLNATVTGNVMEAARTRALSAEDVYAHVDRLGETPFYFERPSDFIIELDEGLGMGFSSLHSLRRDACKKLEELILKQASSRPKRPVPPLVARALRGASSQKIRRSAQLRAAQSQPDRSVKPQAKPAEMAFVVATPDQYEQALDLAPDTIYLALDLVAKKNWRYFNQVLEDAAGQTSRAQAPVPSASALQSSASQAASQNPQLILMTSEVSHDTDAERFAQLLEFKLPTAAGSASALFQAQEAGVNHLELLPTIPMLNHATMEFFFGLGLERLWVSPEMTLAQITELARAARSSQVGAANVANSTQAIPSTLSASQPSTGLVMVVGGRQQLMVMEHCLLMSEGPCNEDCIHCVRRRHRHFLRDRKSYDFPVMTDDYGRSRLFNAVVLDATPEIPELIRAGVDCFVLDVTMISSDQAALMARRMKQAIQGTKLERLEHHTAGHLYRGIV